MTFTILGPTRNATMNFLSTALLALAMSTDAFAAAIGKGAALKKPKFSEALRTGLIFGIIETLTPLFGWAIGRGATQYVAAWDHWIAFSLLLLLGLHMIYAGLKEDESESESIGEKPNKHGLIVLVVTAFATSIDAMAVGVGLAFINVNIIVTAAAIGLATFTMVTIGFMLGRMLGVMVGKRAEIFGGVVLIGVGCYILYEHIYVLK